MNNKETGLARDIFILLCAGNFANYLDVLLALFSDLSLCPINMEPNKSKFSTTLTTFLKHHRDQSIQYQSRVSALLMLFYLFCD
jgi:hypothetical protein